MAEDHRGRGLPPRNDQSDNSRYPSEKDARSRGLPFQSQPPMASGAVTLPSIQDPHGGPGGSRYWDSRSGAYGPSPTSSNGYPPPATPSQPPSYSPSSGSSAYAPPPGPQPYLPPVQAHPQDSRGSYPPSDPRAPPYYPQQRPMAPYGNYDYAYRPDRHPGPYPDYARGGAAVLQQSAPRQRTSIACRYCRRRKIRCSGYQNSPGGKCTNCIKMNQECVFQPVSSSSSTAFVPVSALQNGIPPGTQLFGAYGQPLAGPSSIPAGGGSYQGGNPPYDQPLPSPTGSYGSFTDDRSESNRRRPRPPEDDHGMRLPPPNTFPPDDNRRRSPSSSSPGHLQPYQGLPPQHNPHPGYDNRTPPPRGSPSGPPASGQSSSSVMSLGNIMDSGPGKDIDSNMLGRLNRRN